MCNSQVANEVCGTPIFDDEGEDNQDRDREQVVVEHRVPIRESRCLDSFAHCQNLLGAQRSVDDPAMLGKETNIGSAGKAVDKHP